MCLLSYEPTPLPPLLPYSPTLLLTCLDRSLEGVRQRLELADLRGAQQRHHLRSQHLLHDACIRGCTARLEAATPIVRGCHHMRRRLQRAVLEAATLGIRAVMASTITAGVVLK